MKLDNIIKIYEEEIFKAASTEDVTKRQQEFALIKINEILKQQGTQNPDGSWDIKGNVNISQLHLIEIPVKFNIIKGYFSCSNNLLSTLDGFPKEVYYILYCYNNKIIFEKRDILKICKVGSMIFN